MDRTQFGFFFFAFIHKNQNRGLENVDKGGNELAWLDELKSHLESFNLLNVSKQGKTRFFHDKEEAAFQRKMEHMRKRKAEIVNSNLKAKIIKTHDVDGKRNVEYLTYLTNFIRQNDQFYMEERTEERVAVFDRNKLIDDFSKINEKVLIDPQDNNPILDRDQEGEVGYRFTYNRLAAVQYAERWWNEYNPAYKSFDVDCTNFISQCLHAGGAPMRGYPNRSKGWWMQNNNWSYSWSVANALRWYLSGSKQGLKGMEVESAEQLRPGDVICYDFDGDGRWQHSTIVVAKDQQGMPLVNAHTTNSRMRYWAYEDSSAWTEHIQYKFFHILDD